MSKEKQELIEQLETRRKDLKRLQGKEGDDAVNKDATKDEERLKDEINELKRKLKIIEGQ